MKVGQTITILGSGVRKIRNRIRKEEHGNQWVVIKVEEFVVCLNGPGILIESIWSGDRRWIRKEEIVYEVNL